MAHANIYIDIEEIAEALQKGVEVHAIINKPDKEGILLNVMNRLGKFPTFKTKYLLNPPKVIDIHI